MEGRILSIAGSDSGGGAGIQADTKTITALGGYAATAITLVTAQNTLGIQESQQLDPLLVEQQVASVLDDIGADAIKVGALGSKMVVELVTRQLEAKARSVPIVVDPVILSSSGTSLLDSAGVSLLLKRLVPISALLTPNTEEAELLTGAKIRDEAGMHEACDRFLLAGANAVLLTGGHLETGEVVVDLLRTVDGIAERFEFTRRDDGQRHGTGCTLSSGIATGLAQGLTLVGAIERAQSYLQRAMRSAPRLGGGALRPLDHSWPLPTGQELRPN